MAIAADVSDLQAPENRYERPYKKLLEVYERVGAPNQPPLLFETYFRSSSVAARRSYRRSSRTCRWI